MSGEALGFLIQQLLHQEGVLDTYYTQVLMKKNRPGVLITTLVKSEFKEQVAAYLLSHTSSFGVRSHTVERRILERNFCTFDSPWGKIQLKVGRLDGKVLKITPEYDDVAAIAEKNDKPFSEIFNAAAAYAETLKKTMNENEESRWKNKRL